MGIVQDHTRIVVETGAQIKANHAVHPDWLKALDDSTQYEVTKFYAPFGTYVLAVQPVAAPQPAEVGYGNSK